MNGLLYYLNELKYWLINNLFEIFNGNEMKIIMMRYIIL